MSRYELFVRSHLGDLYRRAREVLESEEDAALAAQPKVSGGDGQISRPWSPNRVWRCWAR